MINSDRGTSSVSDFNALARLLELLNTSGTVRSSTLPPILDTAEARLLGTRSQLDNLAADDAAARQVYQVRAGDTLTQIAAEFGTSVAALVQANGIADPDLIHVGDALVIPDGAAGNNTATPVAEGPAAEGPTAEAPVAPAAEAPAAPASVEVDEGGGSIDARTQAVLDAIPADLRAANPEAAQHVQRILAAADAQNLSADQTAYVLATATHESNLGRHMEEFASGSAYEGRADLGNTQTDDGVRFKGRGYVQITGRANYQDWSDRLGIDLVSNPELAERPDIAARILVEGMNGGTFTGRSVSDFVNDAGVDFLGARRVVNGMDQAARIAGYADSYQAALSR